MKHSAFMIVVFLGFAVLGLIVLRNYRLELGARALNENEGAKAIEDFQFLARFLSFNFCTSAQARTIPPITKSYTDDNGKDTNPLQTIVAPPQAIPNGVNLLDRINQLSFITGTALYFVSFF